MTTVWMLSSVRSMEASDDIMSTGSSLHYTTLHCTTPHYNLSRCQEWLDLDMNQCIPLCFIQLRTSSSSIPLRPALSCPALCCAVLCCDMLCCDMLCCTVLCCAVLCCAVLCCAVLQCTFFSHTVLFLSTCPILSLRPILSCPILLFNLITCTPHLSPFFFHSPLHSSPLHFTPRSSSQLCLAK